MYPTLERNKIVANSYPSDGNIMPNQRIRLPTHTPGRTVRAAGKKFQTFTVSILFSKGGGVGLETWSCPAIYKANYTTKRLRVTLVREYKF